MTPPPIQPPSPRPSLSLLRTVAARTGVTLEFYRPDNHVDVAKGFAPGDPGLGWCWTFQDASDAEAAAILRFWILHETRQTKEFGYPLACSLGHLLAEKGRLVEDQIAPILRETDWTSYGVPDFLLAGLAAFPDGAKRAIKLLDIVPEDYCDGLFLACWHLPSPRVQRKLLSKFLEWTASPAWHGYPPAADWLRFFLCKWIAQGTFSLRRLAPLLQWSARREFALLMP